MTEVRIKISENLFKRLPQDEEKLEQLLKLGLELSEAKANKRSPSIVDETFGLLPVKDHELIEQVLDQIKYGQ